MTAKLVVFVRGVNGDFNVLVPEQMAALRSIKGTMTG
jgi:hypothetical protein